MVAVMNKLTLTLGFALIALMPLATASGLECCICQYEEEGMPDTCNCNSNSPKKDCMPGLNVHQRSDLVTSKANFSAAIFGKKAREGGSYVCAYLRGFRNGKKVVKRGIADPQGLNVHETCKIESYLNEPGYTGQEGCVCNTDWCNCSGCGQLIKSTVMMFAASIFILETTQFSLGDY